MEEIPHEFISELISHRTIREIAVNKRTLDKIPNNNISNIPLHGDSKQILSRMLENRQLNYKQKERMATAVLTGNFEIRDAISHPRNIASVTMQGITKHEVNKLRFDTNKIKSIELKSNPAALHTVSMKDARSMEAMRLISLGPLSHECIWGSNRVPFRSPIVSNSKSKQNVVEEQRQFLNAAASSARKYVLVIYDVTNNNQL
jgi:hypothetical protein